LPDIERYLNLVTSEHADKQKFTSWLLSVLTLVDSSTELFKKFDTYFDLDNAVGEQLDIIGEIVGVSRRLNFQPSISSPILDDETYLLIIKAKIARNKWDGTVIQIKEVWNSLFPEQPLILTDNQDMSVNALIFGFDTILLKELVSNRYIIPKPQGVKFNYAYPADPVFSYGLDTDSFKGYEEGRWLQFV